MKTICVTDDRSPVLLPFERFANSAATSRSNPFEALGVLHNAILAATMPNIVDDMYRGIGPNGDRIYDLVIGAVDSSRDWVIPCICVKQEGCPCTDFLAWITEHFPSPEDGTAVFPRDRFPNSRPAFEAIEGLVRRELDSQRSESFLKYHRELHQIVNRLHGEQCRADMFHRDILSLEERLLKGQLEQTVRQALLISSSVARHSMYLALVSGQGVSKAPEWVGDDASGAALGALAGSPGGPKGAVAGGLIGAGIFSLATATGWW